VESMTKYVSKPF